MTNAFPPKERGALAKREARLAWGLLFPTIFIVSMVIILPLLAIFWISVKPVGLNDLRPVSTVVRESLRGSGDETRIEYRVRNSSQEKPLREVGFSDTFPSAVTLGEIPQNCSYTAQTLDCEFGDVDPGFSERLRIPVSFEGDKDEMEELLEGDPPIARGTGSNILTNNEFTFKNFQRIFDSSEFVAVLWATTFYTVFGTIGALVVGLFAALLLNKSFRFQGVLRGLYLFPSTNLTTSSCSQAETQARAHSQ